MINCFWLPGAKANRPKLEGMEQLSEDALSRIMTLKTVEDTYHMRAFIEQHKPTRAVVIGGGFIGLEAAEKSGGMRGFPPPLYRYTIRC